MNAQTNQGNKTIMTTIPINPKLSEYFDNTPMKIEAGRKSKSNGDGLIL
jgi:hypothetical protein